MFITILTTPILKQHDIFCLIKAYFNIRLILPYMPTPCKRPLSLRFSNSTLYPFVVFPTRTACPTNFRPSHSITLVLLLKNVRNYTTIRYAVCLWPPITSVLTDSNIPLSTHFSNPLYRMVLHVTVYFRPGSELEHSTVFSLFFLPLQLLTYAGLDGK
jgi:hypothetical protein